MYLKNLLQDISILSIFKTITSIIGRYTEEIFATLIAFIFIFNAFKNMSQIGHDNKFAPTTMSISCGCHIPYARHYNPLLIRNRSWILTVHKVRILRKKLLKKCFWVFKNGVKSIQTAGIWFKSWNTVFAPW